ncbi:MAG: hypothetical protein HN341_06695 [Verrucomicrobia bacterium]|nr:hypothetical protein [Verrucomicrobiota bacterium]
MACISCVSVAAESVALAHHPSSGDLRLGLQRRALELDMYEYDNQEMSNGGSLDQEAFVLEYGLADYLYLSLRLGRMSWDTTPGAGGRFDAGDAWGLGVGSVIPVDAWTCGDFSFDLGWSFYYDHATPDDRNKASSLPDSAEIEWWQTSGAAYSKWRNVCGYLGGRYTQVDLTYTHPAGTGGTRRGGFQEDKPFNLFVGAGATFFDALVLRAEWQFTDIEAYELSIYYSLPLGDIL